MPRASQVSRIVCPDCGKTLAINGKVKCHNCGTEVPGFSNVDIIVELVEKLGVDKSLLKTRLFGEENWLDQLLTREDKAHQTFGTSYNRDLFVATAERYGRERIKKWEDKYFLRFSAFPQVAMTQDARFDGWKVKPCDWYYNQVEAGTISLHSSDDQFRVNKKAFELRGEIVLIDICSKPAYRDGKQMFANDKLFLGQIISRLRKAGRVEPHERSPQTSRFGVSANEWEAIVKPEVAKLLGINVSQVRLERAIEANVIPQLYPDARAKDGETNTWIWYEEYFKDVSQCLQRLHGGGVGLASVSRYFSSNHWLYRAFRPLVVLAEGEQA